MAKGEPTNGYCSSSSEEEDGDAAWRAKIDSIAGTTTYISSFTNPTSNGNTLTNKHTDPNESDEDHKPKNQQIKHYQLKVSL